MAAPGDAEPRRFHHKRFPPHSALLSGRYTPDDLAFQSESLKVWYNDRPTEPWADPGPHFHAQSDEMFIVLEGALIVSVDGETVRVEAGEFCCFPAGLLHEVAAIETPLRSLMIQAPSVQDKVYPESAEAD